MLGKGSRWGLRPRAASRAAPGGGCGRALARPAASPPPPPVSSTLPHCCGSVPVAPVPNNLKPALTRKLGPPARAAQFAVPSLACPLPRWCSTTHCSAADCSCGANGLTLLLALEEPQLALPQRLALQQRLDELVDALKLRRPSAHSITSRQPTQPPLPLSAFLPAGARPSLAGATKRARPTRAAPGGTSWEALRSTQCFQLRTARSGPSRTQRRRGRYGTRARSVARCLLWRGRPGVLCVRARQAPGVRAARVWLCGRYAEMRPAGHGNTVGVGLHGEPGAAHIFALRFRSSTIVSGRSTPCCTRTVARR